jgi:hypothetical protein
MKETRETPWKRKRWGTERVEEALGIVAEYFPLTVIQ